MPAKGEPGSQGTHNRPRCADVLAHGLCFVYKGPARPPCKNMGGGEERGGSSSSTPVPPATPVTTTGALENHGTNHQVGENRGSDPSEERATHYPCSLARARTNSSEWTPCRMADAMVQEIPPMV